MQCTLSWTNPPDAGLARVVVRRDTEEFPSGHDEGDLVWLDENPTPGAVINCTDQAGIDNGAFYFYGVYSMNSAGFWNDVSPFEVTPGHTAIGHAREPGDGVQETYALLLVGTDQGDHWVAAGDMRIALTVGWPFDHIEVCKSSDKTREQLEDSIRAYCLKADGDDTLLFYYIGHGGGDVIQYTTTEGTRSTSYHDLSSWLETSAAAEVILLDACNSGTAIHGYSGHYSVPDTLVRPTRWIVSACDVSELAEGWGLDTFVGNSRFTRAFARAVNGGETIAGPDGIISLRDAFNYAYTECSTYSEFYHDEESEQTGRQHPQMWPSEEDRDIELVSEPSIRRQQFKILAMCPVNMVVTDPLGRRISLTENQVGDSAYIVKADFDADGEDEIIVSLLAPPPGVIAIGVVPRLGAAPDDTYSILAGCEDSLTRLADEAEIEAIPSSGYSANPIVNTPAGSDIQVTFIDCSASVEFESVLDAGMTQATTASQGSEFPPHLQLLNGSVVISTAATYAGSITVELCYPDEDLTEYEEAAVRLYKLVDGVALDITTDLDLGANIVSGVTDCLSEFAAAVKLGDVHTPASFRVTGDGDVRADGTIGCSSLEIGAADIAEWVQVSEPVLPGHILVMDVAMPGHYCMSCEPCSEHVAGAVSTSPGLVLGRTCAPFRREALLALAGIVPVLVTDEGGPITPGDLLVTSSTPGRAMRWAGSYSCPCELVGKALEPMMEERGVILVLLTAH